MSSRSLFVLLAVLFAASNAFRVVRDSAERTVQQVAPGARAQVSQKALDYFSTALLPVFVDEVPNIRIPDQSGSDSGFRWSISNVRLTNPRVDRPAFRFAAGQGLQLELNDIKLDVRVSYSARGEDICESVCVPNPFGRRRRACHTQCVPNPLSASGDASCSPTASATGLVVLGVSNGKPTVHLSNPAVRIDMGNINIHGSDIGWLVELLVPIFQGDLERALENELKNLVASFVNDDLAGILDKLELKVGVPASPPFGDSGMHFNLTSINAYSDHIGVDMSVATVDPRDPNRLVRQPVNTVIPDAFDTSKMLSVSLAPEVIEDLLHFHQDKWSLTLQPHDVPSDSEYGLNTSSLARMTTRALDWIFGEKDMQLTHSLGGNASVRFGEGAIELNLPSLFKFDVKHDDAEPEHAFTLQCPVDGNVAVRVEALFDQSVCTASKINVCGNLHCGHGCGSNFNSCVEALNCRSAVEYQSCGALHCSRGCGGNFQECIQPFADAEPEGSHIIRSELQSLSITNLTAHSQNSNIWLVNTWPLSIMLGLMQERVIMPALNQLMNGGVACCEGDGFALRQLTSRISSDALTVFSDIALDLRSILRS